MAYTTYLFDFDYTLADSSHGIVICFQNVLNRHGFTTVTEDAIKRTIGRTLEESFSILSGVTDAEQLATFRTEYVKEADTHMTVNTVLFPETKSVLLALKNAGARIGIISTKYRYRIQEVLNQHFPDNFVDIVVGGEDVKSAKPSPEGVLYAIEQLHVNKAEVLYIGDSTIDAETAQVAGVDFAGVTHGVTTANELSKYPHWKIMSTLKELLEVVSPCQKKFISKWQIALLLLMLWFAFEELDTSYNSWLFSIPFLLTLWGISQKRRILPHKVKALIAPWWHPCKVRLRALHIKLVNGRKMPPINNVLYTCQNCNTTYNGNFCNRCGQSCNTPRYRPSNALKNIAGGFTNIDSGFGRTLIELLYRPGFMIKDFIGGKRVQYFRPFQTLFVLAALYIMCVQLVDPKSLDPQQNKQEKTSSSQQEAPMEMDTLATPKTSVAKTAGNKNDLIDDLVQDGSKVTHKLEAYLQHSPFLMKVWNLMKSWAHGNKAFRIIATLPLFALATQFAVHRRKKKKKYNLTEHTFIQAFIACQILLLSILILPFNGRASISDLYEVPLWFIFFLFCWDYKQLYGFGWWKSFWGTMRMFFYSLLLIMLFAMLVVLIVVAASTILKL